MVYIRPSLIVACRNPKMRWIFGSQNRIDNPYYNETRIRRLFLNKAPAKRYQQRRSLDYGTYSHEFVTPEHLSTHADEPLKVGRGKPRRVRFARGGLQSFLPPRSRRSRASTTTRRNQSSCPRPRHVRVVCVLCLVNAAIATVRRVARLS